MFRKVFASFLLAFVVLIAGALNASASVIDRGILYNNTGGTLYVNAARGSYSGWSNKRRENIHWHNPKYKIRIWAAGNCQTMVYHYRGGLAMDVIDRIGKGGTYITISRGLGKTVQRWCR